MVLAIGDYRASPRRHTHFPRSGLDRRWKRRVPGHGPVLRLKCEDEVTSIELAVAVPIARLPAGRSSWPWPLGESL